MNKNKTQNIRLFLEGRMDCFEDAAESGQIIISENEKRQNNKKQENNKRTGVMKQWTKMN